MAAIRFERRLDVSTRQAALARVGGAVAALLLAGLLLLLTGRNPFSLLADGISATVGDRQGIDETLVIATPILMNALAVAIALRLKVWNIGSEGQFFMGAWAAAGVGLYLDLPAPLLLVLMALAGMAAGAVWILVPALSRAYWNVNEIITTLLLNFVAIQWVFWFSLGQWRDTKTAVVQSTPEVNATLPDFPGSTTLHIGFLVPIVIAVIMFLVFRYSRWGYEVDMIGGNPRAAAFAGIPVKRRIVTVMLLSGAIAGLSGMIHLAGAAIRLNGSISNNYGLSGFIVAALAGNSIVGLVAGGLFIAAMLHAGVALQSEGFSVFIVAGVYGLVLAGIGLGEVAARFRLVRPAPASSAPAAPAPVVAAEAP
jgi:simple sugar transport system permease protein